MRFDSFNTILMNLVNPWFPTLRNDQNHFFQTRVRFTPQVFSHLWPSLTYALAPFRLKGPHRLVWYGLDSHGKKPFNHLPTAITPGHISLTLHHRPWCQSTGLHWDLSCSETETKSEPNENLFKWNLISSHQHVFFCINIFSIVLISVMSASWCLRWYTQTSTAESKALIA